MDNSSAIFDGAYKGAAIGTLQYVVPAGGEDGNLLSYVLVTDVNHAEYMMSNFTGGWSTEQSWLSDGFISTEYQFVLVPEHLKFNFTSDFHYGDNDYNTGIALSLNEEPMYLVAKGNGGYGGDWYDW